MPSKSSNKNQRAFAGQERKLLGASILLLAFKVGCGETTRKPWSMEAKVENASSGALIATVEMRETSHEDQCETPAASSARYLQQNETDTLKVSLNCEHDPRTTLEFQSDAPVPEAYQGWREATFNLDQSEFRRLQPGQSVRLIFNDASSLDLDIHPPLTTSAQGIITSSSPLIESKEEGPNARIQRRSIRVLEANAVQLIGPDLVVLYKGRDLLRIEWLNDQGVVRNKEPFSRRELSGALKGRVTPRAEVGRKIALRCDNYTCSAERS